MLAECTLSIAALLPRLNRHKRFHYIPGYGGCERIDIYATFSRDFLVPLHETDRTTIRHLKLPGLRDVVLGVAHLPSKLRWSDESQVYECVRLSRDIIDVERRVGHSRTVLIGDLNMNPFESGIVSAMGLHATMSQQVARRTERTVQGQRHPFFYNPMWSLYGDKSKGPPATYYYPTSEHKAYFWNMFDQVLVRPDLLDRFSFENLEVLRSSGATALIDANGIPDRRISDHLPLLFGLRL